MGCSEQRKDSVKESTKKALRQKLLSNRISGNTGKNGKTVSAKGSVLGILERKQGNAVGKHILKILSDMNVFFCYFIS